MDDKYCGERHDLEAPFPVGPLHRPVLQLPFPQYLSLRFEPMRTAVQLQKVSCCSNPLSQQTPVHDADKLGAEPIVALI